MIQKMTSPKSNHARVLFELPSSFWADRVFVVGDFNKWSPTTPLTQARDGAWQALLDLPTGHQYHFRYLADGAWHTEFQADGFAVTSDGLPTSVLNLL